MLTSQEMELGRRLVRAVILSDRVKYDSEFDAAGLELNQVLGIDIAAFGLALTDISIIFRRARRRPPGAREQDEIVQKIESRPFADAIDPDLVRKALMAICGEPRTIHLRGEPLFITSMVVLGGVVLDHTARHGWDGKYGSIHNAVRRRANRLAAGETIHRRQRRRYA